MLKKVYYYNFNDIDDTYSPFHKGTMSSFIQHLLQLDDPDDLSNYQLPADLSTNAVYNELLSLIMGRYHEHAIIKISKCFNEEPSDEEVENELYKWGIKFISLLNMTYEYYTTLLAQYAGAKADLMADIKATSKNAVSFNDTPQNPNTAGVYEGDDYITHFTKTSGETSSPLMSKIMRLKEIQDNYRDLMSSWVRDFERIFYQEEVN